MSLQLEFREEPRADDVAAVRAMAAGVGVFSPIEQAVAVELVEERLRKGPASGYSFTFADAGGAPVGYSAWGPIPLTESSYDLYWIIVDAARHGTGIGRDLIAATEQAVQLRGGRRLYVETSSRDGYRRTRRFYEHVGYAEVARLEHFYATDDAKIVYCKALDWADTLPGAPDGHRSGARARE